VLGAGARHAAIEGREEPARRQNQERAPPAAIEYSERDHAIEAYRCLTPAVALSGGVPTG
jgi:hypothetical protein